MTRDGTKHVLLTVVANLRKEGTDAFEGGVSMNEELLLVVGMSEDGFLEELVAQGLEGAFAKLGPDELDVLG